MTEKQKLSPLQLSENYRLNARITELTKELEELRSEKEQIIFSLGKSNDKDMKDVKSWIDGREAQIQKAESAETKYSAELEKALAEYQDLGTRVEELDPDELKTARLSFQPEEEQRAVFALENAYGVSYDPAAMQDAENKVADLLGEEPIDNVLRSFRENLGQMQKDAQQHELSRRKKSRNLER